MNEPTKPAMGVDPGTARVGVALSDDLRMLAHPLETIDCRKSDPVERIDALARERDVGVIVVGHPRNMDGTAGPAAAAAEAFAERLRDGTGRAVVLWDERLSTLAAERGLRAAGRDSRRSKAIIDQAAAREILQSWLDAQAGGG